jgi:flagellar basal-body rod protein FlgC
MDLLKSIQISASGLSANRTKMKVIAENLANVGTTRTEEGGPYKRKLVVFEEAPFGDFRTVLAQQSRRYSGVSAGEIIRSPANFRMVYDPAHPDANPKTGYVAMPNVNLLTEIADMMVARRAYDASVTAISNTKSMILKALEIGK